MASPNTNQLPLSHPNTDAHGYGWDKRADFEGFVEDQHYMVHRTSERLVDLLSKDGKTIVKEENSLTVAETLTEAVKEALKTRYNQNMISDKPKTYKEIIDGFYFTFERMDLRAMVQQAYKKMREKEKQETAEDEVIDALSQVILDCMDNATEHNAADFQGYPFEMPDSTHSPLVVTPEIIEEFYKLVTQISSEGDAQDLISRKIGQHLVSKEGEKATGVELFRMIERLYHEMRSEDAIRQLEAVKAKLYELVKQNVEFRNSAFNNGTFLSLAATFAAIVVAMSNVDGIDKGMVVGISIALFGLWMAKGAKATEKVINAYKAKIDIEFDQLLSVERLLAILGGVIAPMTSEELTYQVAQKNEGLSASAAQKNSIRGQKRGGNIALGLGMVVAAVYGADHIPVGDSTTLYHYIEHMLTGR